MESNNHTADAAFETWNELYSALKGAARERNLEFRRPEEFRLLIQNKERMLSLRVWFLPELKKLRYNAGMGWQELSAIDRAEQPVVFQTAHRQQYSVRELCDLMLGQLEKSRFDGLSG